MVAAVYLAVGVVLGVAVWTLLWLALTVGYNRLGWARRWYGKNASIAVATFAQLTAAWQLAGPVTPDGWRLIVVIVVLFNLVMSVQDLRDIAGDRRVGRRTLPMVIGHWPTRIFAAAGLAVLPAGAHIWIFDSRPVSLPARLGEALLAMVAWIAACRVLTRRTPGADHRTYQLYTGWYCLLMIEVVLAWA
jgi:4-hydroxybenzoate polyprenyltransferase